MFKYFRSATRLLWQQMMRRLLRETYTQDEFVSAIASQGADTVDVYMRLTHRYMPGSTGYGDDIYTGAVIGTAQKNRTKIARYVLKIHLHVPSPLGGYGAGWTVPGKLLENTRTSREMLIASIIRKSPAVRIDRRYAFYTPWTSLPPNEWKEYARQHS
jgi:hypothetical protein